MKPQEMLEYARARYGAIVDGSRIELPLGVDETGLVFLYIPLSQLPHVFDRLEDLVDYGYCLAADDTDD